MGINIGLDIGSISLKLAALGQPADRPILEPLSAAGRPFRQAAGALPLVLSEYRRIAGSPIQSAYDLLHEFYDVVPEHRVEGIRVTGSRSRTIAKILGLYFRKRIQGHRPHDRRVLSARAYGLRDRRRKLQVHPPGESHASWITTAAASARPAPDRFSISRRCA